MRERIKSLPGIVHLRKWQYDRRFFNNQRNENLFRGAYATFAEAVDSLPELAPLGYDQPGTPAMYREVMSKIREWDYPVLYWLDKDWQDIAKVFDFGGHIGILYYGLGHYLNYSDEFRWQVHDVKAVMEEGAAIAKGRNAKHLCFTESFADASGSDLVLASGSLQYFETPFYETLESLSQRPKRVLINMMPLHGRQEFVTVSSMGPTFCPYKVFHLDRFLTGMKERNWQLVDSWVNPGKECHIPFQPQLNGSRYCGMYYRNDR